MMMMVKIRMMQSQEILPNNTCESLLPLIRRLDCRIRMVSFTLGTRKQKIKEKNIIVGDKEYAGTPGL